MAKANAIKNMCTDVCVYLYTHPCVSHMENLLPTAHVHTHQRVLVHFSGIASAQADLGKLGFANQV